MNEKPHLSATQLSMAGRCMEQYRRAYIEKERIPPGVAMVVGHGTHKGIEPNMRHKIQHGELLPLEQIQDITRDAVVKRWGEEGVNLEKTEQEKGWQRVQAEAIDMAISLTSLHYTQLAPTIHPIHVERPWRVELPNFSHDLIGYIDLQESGLVIDTKTAGQTPPGNDADIDDQLTVYALAGFVLDGEIPALRKDYLVKRKVPRTAQLSTTRTKEDFAPILARIETLSLCIEKGVFPPTNQGNWWCSERFCGYAQTCKYFRRKR